MFNSQTPNPMQLQFGLLAFTPTVVERLHDLDFTVAEFTAAVAEHKSSLDGEPSIYCSTYGKYNAGSLRGLWIDLSTFSTFDEFINFCQALHADEEDPELMFEDYEGFPSQFYSESCMDEEMFDNIAEYTKLCELHGTDAVDDYLELHDDLGNFEEDYMGEWRSEEDFARHIAEDCYDVFRMTDGLERYFDYEAFARDLFMYDYTMGANGNVFRNF